MARVHIVLSRATQRNPLAGGRLPIPDSVPIGSDTKTTSATSQLSDLVATDTNAVWNITPEGAVFVKFGPASPTPPVAVTDDGWLLLAGVPRDFAVSAVGETVAFKDA